MDRKITNKAETAKEIVCRTTVSGTRRKTGTRRGRTQGQCLADDVFLAATVGNSEWLDASLQIKYASGSGDAVCFDENGMAPIHLAAASGHLSALELLVEKYGVDVNLANKGGLRPLHLCLNQKNGDNGYQCLVYLLKKDASSSVVDDEGNSPMHHAASEGNVKCVKELLRTGASVLILNKLGQKPFNLAQLKGHRVTANLLRDSEWHERSKVASQEARLLEKLHMQCAVEEMQQYSQLQDLCSKYNKQAFDEWLNKHGFDRRVQSVADVYPSVCSSRARNGSAIKVCESSTSAVLSGKKVSKKYRHVKNSAMEKPVKNQKCALESDINNDAIVAWKPSRKATEVCHIPRLKDHYPRDPYTFLPQFSTKRRSDAPSLLLAKKELERLGVHRNFEGEDMTFDELKSLTDSLNLSENSSDGVVFRCKSIVDVKKRRHYDPDSLTKPEISLHLTNDVRSTLFQYGLYSGIVSRLAQNNAQSDPGHCPLQENCNVSHLLPKTFHNTNTHYPSY